ncbi:WS/DGAT/MGAT family O-acyltransferase [Nocardioides sp. CPCC 206347]|uniref:WS/DGAT/MGAT family O-acyltransferase n=1 Tax=unclassified Nocardioides TaxID=2615069 RepID=UPI003606801E
MVSAPAFRPIDPTSAGFLLAENRNMPMHVGSLQLFEKPDGVGPDYIREMFESMRDTEKIAPLFLKHPYRSVTTAGALFWRDDDQFDIEHHVRHSALPQPGRVRELLDLCGRLHSTRLAWERPLWETHVIEGLADGRVAMYTKMHHSLVDGISAMRLLASVLSTDPDRRNMPAPFAEGASRKKKVPEAESLPAAAAGAAGAVARTAADLPADVFRSALSISGEAAGMPLALMKTLRKGMRNETSAVSMSAPRTIFNQSITGARRFAAQDWPTERLRTVGKSTGTTINDVVLAMCSGALQSYLDELGELPDAPLVSMVPIGLNAKQAGQASSAGGNAVGSIMVRLPTDVADAGERLRSISRSMKDGKEALSSMTPLQIVAMSAIGMTPSIVLPLLGLQGIVQAPVNLVISNVPGPRVPHYWNGAKLVGNYPLSIPINGMALNITCTSYDGNMAFGLTGCRRTVPHLQRLLTYLDDDLAALEKAAGLS